MECLITKLKGVVSDNSLLGLNELRLTFHNESSYTNKSIALQFTEATTIKALNGGQISLQENSGFGTSVYISNSSYTTVYLSDGDVEISIPNKFNLVLVRCEEIYVKGFNIDSLKHCKNLSEFYIITDSEIHGDIGSLKNLPLTRFALINGNSIIGKVTGDISILNNINSLNIINAFSEVSGTITKLNTSFGLKLDDADDSAWIDIPNENNISTSLRLFNVNANIRSLDLRWLYRATSLTNIGFHSNFGTAVKDMTIKGNICKLISDKNINIGNVFIKNVKGTDLQTLSDLPNTSYFVSSGGNIEYSQLLPLSWEGNTKNRTGIIALENVHFKLGTAQFIKDMSNLTLEHSEQSYLKNILIGLADDLTSSAAAGDSALQSAISTLQGKGVTVSIGYSDTAANGIALMSALDADAPKYGLVYKGKELIVEPVNTSKTLIAPANDCTYKEFDTLEEAQAFVSSNGLVKVESK